MTANPILQEPLQLTTIRNRSCIPVSWDWAEEWQTRLRKEGVRSTLQLDLASREAHLEIWPGTDPARVRAALDKLQGRPVAGK
jgi:hypothetical protein